MLKQLKATFLAGAMFLLSAGAHAQDPIYRCGGEYTNSVSVAQAKNCKLISPKPEVTRAVLPQKRGVPRDLFGIKLGGKYFMFHGDAVENLKKSMLPASKVLSWSRFLSLGTNFYIKPLREHSEYKYLEFPADKNPDVLQSTFSTYLVPQFPRGINTEAELAAIPTDAVPWLVSRIKWRDEAATERDNYYWAHSTCNTLKHDISVKPEILDLFKDNQYSCKFSEGDRVFEIASWHGREVSLSFNSARSKVLERDLDELSNRINAEKLRPYQ